MGSATGADSGANDDPANASYHAAESDSFEDAFDALLEEEEDLPEGFPDPMENANRKILKFNQGANKWIIDPVSRSYAFLVPDRVRFAIRRFFANLNAPTTFGNDLLQLEWKDASMTFGALVINSTLGLGGLFQPAKLMGLPRHRSDFGQTLALARVESGPYLVVPIMGPTNVRDATGKIVDLFLRPASWFLGFGTLSILSSTSEGIVIMESHHKDFAELEKSSVDFYPVLRSAFYQNRMGEIWDRRQHRKP